MYRSGTDFDCPTKRGRLNVLRAWTAIELVLRTTLDPPQSAQTLRETPVRTDDSPQINLKKNTQSDKINKLKIATTTYSYSYWQTLALASALALTKIRIHRNEKSSTEKGRAARTKHAPTDARLYGSTPSDGSLHSEHPALPQKTEQNRTEHTDTVWHSVALLYCANTCGAGPRIGAMPILTPPMPPMPHGGILAIGAAMCCAAWLFQILFMFMWLSC